MHDFKATDRRSISLRRGERVVLKSGSLKNGWWVGSLHGKTAWIPATFVQAEVKESTLEKGEENPRPFLFIEDMQLRKDLRNMLSEAEFEEMKDLIFKIGDQQIGAKIVEDGIDFMVFFWDPLTAQPHDPDVKALLRIAVLYNIPMACNRSSADFLISSPLMEKEYNLQLIDYGNRIPAKH